MKKIYSIKILISLIFFAVTDAEVFGGTTHPNHYSEDVMHLSGYTVLQ